MMTKTTKRYPCTRVDAEREIARAVTIWGPNQAHGDLSYRRGGKSGLATRESDGLVAFSYIASARTPGAYRQIGYAS
jgi:hypothetical protein